MKRLWKTALFLGLFAWIPVTYSYSSQAPEDQDSSGDDEEFSGSGMAEYEPVWVNITPVMTKEQTTRTPVTTPLYPARNVSKNLLTTSGSLLDNVQIEETTTVSLVDPEETTRVMEKEFVPVVEDDFTTKTVKEDIKPTVSVKTTNKNIPYVETTRKAELTNPKPEATTMTTTVTTGIRNDIEGFINSDNREKINSGMDADFEFDNEIIPRRADPVNESGMDASSADESLLEKKEVLACVVAGGVVGLMFSAMLVALMVYRMKKKDEGSYALQEMPHLYDGYQKPHKQVEFFA